MNREIKFRVWDTDHKKWVKYLTYSIDDFSQSNKSWHKVMQYTGLKSTDECNMVPKECYFGDIIRFYTTDGDERVCEVLWYETDHCIGFKRLSDGFIYTQRHFNDSGYFQPSKIQFEIIGNIYEHPHLLPKEEE